MDSVIYDIWLAECIGVENSRVPEMYRIFTNAEKIYTAKEDELRLSGIFRPAELGRILKKSLYQAEDIMNQCTASGCRAIGFTDNDYPSRLRGIEAPPAVIYIKGSLPDENTRRVAIVGTRHATPSGKHIAFKFGCGLAKKGVIIVSGGAEGIDSDAHKGALSGGGQTLCVMGCGFNSSYLSSFAAMRREISNHGALISEYPPDTEPAAHTFPKRNRIISALSDCTLVVEAGMDSGSLITASYTAKEKKRIFAVPGSVGSPNSQGTNYLLTTGAYAAVDYRDILKWFDSQQTADPQRIVDDTAIKKARSEVKQRRRRTDTSGNKVSSDTAEEIYGEVSLQPVIKTEMQTRKTEEVQEDEKSLTKTNKSRDDIAAEVDKTTNFLKERLTENALTVYHTISDTPIIIEKIEELVGLDYSEVISALTELELTGLITSVSFGEYVRK